MSDKNKPGIFPGGLKMKNGMVFLILGIGAGLLLIFLSSFGKQADSIPAGNPARENIPTLSDALEYISRLEDRLAEIISGIGGVSDVRVLITAEGSSEFVYAARQSVKENESRTSNGVISRESQEDLILARDAGRGEHPIFVMENMPRIRGVAVVCKGGGSAEIKLEIISLVSAALGIPTNRIFVYN